VAVSGAEGRMGRMTCVAVESDPELLLVAKIDPLVPSDARSPGRFRTLDEAIAEVKPDVVVDFTSPAVVKANVFAGLRAGIPMVVGTTGLNAGDLAEIDREAAALRTPVLVAPNFAMGAVLMMEFARQAATRFQDCEIVELHHEAKVDAPSGTSRLTRDRIGETWRQLGIDKEVPIHSVRLPGLIAHQEVIFGGTGETLTIRHDSLSRESFMPGVLLAVKRIRERQGLIVGLENIL
jgi:4-hydroxy-tetrahydrodipicolinate reductase